MTRLTLALSCSRPESKPVRYLPLLADETVASWADRHPSIKLTSDSKHEHTFGQLVIDLPDFPCELRKQLERAAVSPDAWLLQPHERTLQCPRCIAEDWSQGVPSYNRRMWCVAWRTCCPRHGTLFDTDNLRVSPRWVDLLDSPMWNCQDLTIVLTRPHGFLLHLSLASDHRAIHLEAALAGRQRGVWFPEGMDLSSLRATYREIVSDLLAQFYLERGGSEDQHPNPGFNRAHNGNRFAINVLAEAILSDWTGSPLPETAMCRRTGLLVRAIGWGESRPPRVRAGQVLIEGPSRRKHSLDQYSQWLPSKMYDQLVKPMDDEHVGYLTLPEARLLGLSCSVIVSSLRRMVAQGQFLAFEARHGCLTENSYLPESARLRPGQEPTGAILPMWAFRSVPVPTLKDSSGELCNLFEIPSANMAVRKRARIRRILQEEKTSVRFCPDVHRKGTLTSNDEPK